MNGIEKKTVVITGTSSGIGRSSASRLVQSGWQVFAIVRKPADGQRLQSGMGPGLTPVIMDMTDRMDKRKRRRVWSIYS